GYGYSSVRVVAVDSAGHERFDDRFIQIPSGEMTGTLRITSDYAGQTLRPGQSFDVTFVAEGDVRDHVLDAYLLLDNDAYTISLGGVAGSLGQLPIARLPYVSTDRARLVFRANGGRNRVKWFYGESFSIRPDPRVGDAAPSVSVVSPSPGAAFPAGSDVRVSWSAFDDEGVRSFAVLASYDAGRRWNLIAEDLPATATSYDFRTAAGTGFSDVRVRVVATDRRFQQSSAETSFALSTTTPVPTATPTPTPAATPTPTPAPTPTPTPAPTLTNFALAANGGVATASSTTTQQELPGLDFSPSGVIDGDRRGLNWEHGGGWRDATNNSFPDWVQVDFPGARSVSQVDVFSLQDNYASPAQPTEATPFTKYGVSAFDVLYWDGAGWAAVPGASVVGNDKVWRRLTFPAVTTTRLRVVVRNALAGRSRLVEVEAWGAAADAPPPPAGTRINAALASNGGQAIASSVTTQQELPGLDFSPSGVINGDRKGLNWEHGGGWRDATNNAYPDWVEVAFAAPTAVDEVSVFSLQDNYTSPSEPTEQTTFTKYGVTVFSVQHWDGAQWLTVPGGTVTNNGNVWRKLTFPAVTTTKIRVVVNNALAGRSRLVEVEAWGTQAVQPPPPAGKVNHAAAASGAVATASSTTTQQEFPGLDFSPAGVINGDRRGLNWEHGGGWRDATNNTYPDWVQVDFPGSRKVDEVNVFSLQDNYTSPAEPTEAMTFTKYGVTAFEVQYWDGSAWVTVPGGTVTNNGLVWRKVTFPQVMTTKVRVVVHNAVGGRSRLVEVEARGPAS
ncbi:MAG TPA: hypothetical protein VF611_01035, partial [Pyrinomonadaceae bacterium]